MYGNPHARSPRLRVGALTGAGAMVVALALTGCSSSPTASDSMSAAPAITADTGKPITVWVDADRVAASDAYKAAFPNDPVTVETYDGSANGSGTFRTKIQLFDTSGSGWPDVVFSTQNNDAAWASQGSQRQAGLRRRSQQWAHPGRNPKRIRHGRPRPVHRRREGLLPAQRPGSGRHLVRQDAHGPIWLLASHDVGGVPGSGRQGRFRAPRLHHRRAGRPLDAGDLSCGRASARPTASRAPRR